MSVSAGEIIRYLAYLPKISGKMPRTQFSRHDYPLDTLMGLIAAPDHKFIPSIEVTDTPIALDVNGFIYSIKVEPGSAPCKVNFDREITPAEYTVVHPGVIKIVSRLAKQVWLQAPSGQVSRVTVEALKLG